MNCRNRVGQTVVGAVVFGAVMMAAPLGAQGLANEDGARPVSLREAIELKPERHEFREAPTKIIRFMSQTGG